MSRLAPGLFSISCNPMMRRLTGLSKSRRKGEAVTVTPASSVRFSSISIEMFRSLVDKIYSGVVTAQL